MDGCVHQHGQFGQTPCYKESYQADFCERFGVSCVCIFQFVVRLYDVLIDLIGWCRLLLYSYWIAESLPVDGGVGCSALSGGSCFLLHVQDFWLLCKMVVYGLL